MASFHFAYPYLIYVLLPVWLCLVWYRWKAYKSPVYRYALSSVLDSSCVASMAQTYILFVLRAGTLLGLIFLVGRPQWVDTVAPTHVEGIDIMLVLDVSGSMNSADGSRMGNSRLSVAKQEAINFVTKRINDPCGLVIFGQDVMTRCPLTLDKTILKSVIEQLRIGFIDHRGTALFSGLATALNRLKSSDAKSKVIILLTDGEPTPEEINEEVAMNLAQKLGVKIYTIGIGGALSFGRYTQMRGDAVNMALLERIATQTGGQAFQVKDGNQLRVVYETIDQLETTQRDIDTYYQYHEAFYPYVWLIIILLVGELFLRLFIWRGVWW